MTAAPTLAPTRWHSFDQLRVLATFGVIALHSGALVATTLADTRPDLVSSFNVGNAADSLGTFAVNCFFMVSGALLLVPTRRFRLASQLLKVAIPVLVWIGIYVVANLWMNSRGVGAVGGSLQDPDRSPGDFVRLLVGQPAAYHLWFVYVLLTIYLLVPLLRAITDRPEPQRRRLLLWLLALWAATLVLPWGTHWWDGFPVPYFESVRLLPATYLGVFVLGYVIHQYRPPVPRWVFAVGAGVGLTWTFLSTWLGARSGAEDWAWGLENLNPPALLYSVCVFAWFATRDAAPGRLGAPVAHLSALSFRIYLLHALVLHLLWRLTPIGDLITTNALAAVALLFAGTAVISVLLAWAIDLVRPIRRYV